MDAKHFQENKVSFFDKVKESRQQAKEKRAAEREALRQKAADAQKFVMKARTLKKNAQ